MRKALAFVAAAIIMVAAGSVAVAQFPAASDHAGHGHGRAAPAGGGHAAPALQQFAVTVTADGFVPARIVVNRDTPVKLLVTRKTDQTCAKEIVIAEYGIRHPLPLGQPVTIEFTPTRSGQLRYACAMDMVAGVLVVE